MSNGSYLRFQEEIREFSEKDRISLVTFLSLKLTITSKKKISQTGFKENTQHFWKFKYS